MCHSDLQIKRLKHMPDDECVVLFWRKGLAGGKMFGRVDYIGVLDATNTPPRFTTVLNNVPRISVDKFVDRYYLTEWLKVGLRPELKRVALMKDLLRKFQTY